MALAKERIETVKIRERASNLEDLLWNTLQEALSKTDARGLFAYSIKVLKIKRTGKGYKIDATLRCKKQSAEYSKLEVKGISKYDLKVERKNKGFIIRTVLDV